MFDEEGEVGEFKPLAATYLLLALLHGVGLRGFYMKAGRELLRNWSKIETNCGRSESPIPGMNSEQAEKHFQKLADEAEAKAERGLPTKLEAGKHLYAMYEQHQFLGGPNAEGGGLRWFTINGQIIMHGTTWFNNGINHLGLNWRTCSVCGENITDEQFAEGLIDDPYCNTNSRFGNWTSHEECVEKVALDRKNGDWLFDVYLFADGERYLGIKTQSAFVMGEMQFNGRIQRTKNQ